MNLEVIGLVIVSMVALASTSIGIVGTIAFASQAYKHAKETINENFEGKRLTYEEDTYDCNTFVLLAVSSIWFFALAIFGMLFFILMGVVYL